MMAEQTERLTKVQLQRLPRQMRQSAILFRFGFGIFLFLSGLLGLWGCSASLSPLSWSSAATQIDEEQLFHLIVSNVSDKTRVAEVNAIGASTQIALLGASPDDASTLYLFQLNHPQACGQLGCLHVIASVSELDDPQIPQTLWSRYLHPDSVNTRHHSIQTVPPPTGAIEASEYPCLEITQIGQVSLHRTTECYVDGQYQIMEKQQSQLES